MDWVKVDYLKYKVQLLRILTDSPQNRKVSIFCTFDWIAAIVKEEIKNLELGDLRDF